MLKSPFIFSCDALTLIFDELFL